MADYNVVANPEFVDPALRQAVHNITQPVLSTPTGVEEAQAKGYLKVEEPPKFNYGTAINEAVMRRAQQKLYDPTISEGLQKYRYVTNQAQKLQNASDQIMNIYKLDRQAEDIVRQRKAAEDAQRASVLSSVLGLGGAVVGAYLAGPVGAAVGSQVGNVAAQQNQPNQSQGTGYLGVNTKF